jgi:hypothetical protein
MENVNYKEMSLNDLSHRAEVLKELCHRLNPYEPIASQDLKALQEVGISQIEDPFHLTNTLILYVEDTLEEISKRKQLH